MDNLSRFKAFSNHKMKSKPQFFSQVISNYIFDVLTAIGFFKAWKFSLENLLFDYNAAEKTSSFAWN